MQTTLRTVSAGALALRDPSNKAVDAAALRAIAQAAVEVELFTIPLYMTALYSIQGMHQITGAGNSFYQGRLWPGPATVAEPASANEKAFNIVFNVFIQEMLHLQLAANMATTINPQGAAPNFTSPALMNPATHAWTCYGPELTVIPHIIDLKDTINQQDVKVNTAGLTREQLQLFLAIEQPDGIARGDIQPDKIGDYFPPVPFANWQPGQDLPMFGTIGYMYQCYFDYLNLKYSDGSSLWDEVFYEGGQQNDEFNSFDGAGHPMREFMGFEASVAQTYPDIAFAQMGLMMDAITDQGEGSTLVEKLRFAHAGNLQATRREYQASIPALRSDYPSYSDTGTLEPSADAAARGDNDKKDHYECFKEILQVYVDDVVLWPAWLATHGPWTAADLTTTGYVANPQIPSPDDVAGSLNLLANPPPGSPDYYKLLSQASGGAIAGVTTVLDQFWSAQAQSASPVPFPFPSMSGSGDRMAICWAVFGKAPDLSIGLDPPKPDVLYHSCQGIDYNATGGNIGTNSCAEVTVFHSCRGSNGCHAQGGCGFVQPTTGGGNCSASMSTASAKSTREFGAPNRCTPPQAPNLATMGGCNPFAGPAYSPPGDNKCVTFGGCAVPISASQVFPRSGNMQLYKFVQVGGKWTSQELTGQKIDFAVGENVHDIAWKAYFEVMQPGTTPPPPKPTPLRLAFPPST
ncbi:MAG TPA: ferritin-like domain-containing protein [Caulobacteraceae bacterium]|nr:ferritin-like domain-containing protein [Caulobacteraceae bacterium]